MSKSCNLGLIFHPMNILLYSIKQITKLNTMYSEHVRCLNIRRPFILQCTKGTLKKQKLSPEFGPLYLTEDVKGNTIRSPDTTCSGPYFLRLLLPLYQCSLE